MTLRARLALGLVVIAVVLMVPLAVARQSIKRLHGDVRALREGEFQASLVLGRLRDALADVRSREVAFAAVNPDTVHAQLAAALRRADVLTDSLSRFELKDVANRMRGDLATIAAGAEREYESARAGAGEQADSISRRTIQPALRDAERALAPAEQTLRTRTRERVDLAEEALADAERASLASLAIALLIATAIALWLTRSISGPVYELERGMRAVAGG
ncbi:MAG: hypothetical protein H0W68_07695, partial [Gemmatimonadaceae bacterium]|nr:hypothetical protein [Gemmatimonadaceae bacterium]